MLKTLLVREIPPLSSGTLFRFVEAIPMKLIATHDMMLLFYLSWLHFCYMLNVVDKIWPCQLLRLGTTISLSCLQVPVCFRDQFPVVLCRSSCRVSFAVH